MFISFESPLVVLLALLVTSFPVEVLTIPLSKAKDKTMNLNGYSEDLADSVQMVVVGHVGEINGRSHEDNQHNKEYRKESNDERSFIPEKEETKKTSDINVLNQPVQIVKINDLEILRGKIRANNLVML